MAAITTIIAGASLALGAAGTVAQMQAQKKAEKQAKERNRIAKENAEKQETRAREAAALRGPDQQEARVKLGADGESVRRGGSGSNQKGSATRTTSTGVNQRRLFGTGGTSASRIGGL